MSIFTDTEITKDILIVSLISMSILVLFCFIYWAMYV